MNLEYVLVLVLGAVALMFLILAERNSRRSQAKLKAEAAAKAGATPPSGHASEPQEKGEIRKK